MRLAAAAPGRDRLGLVADWLLAQLNALGVPVEQRTAHDEQADIVLRCTGARPQPRRFVERGEGARVVSPRDVLAGIDGSGHAVVLDEAGDHAAMGAAEWLHAHGWSVTVVTADMFVGQRLTATQELTPYNQRAHGKQIVFRPQLDVLRVGAGGIEAVDVFSREPVSIPADLVVDASYEVPLVDGDAGDAVAPRRIGQAILEGHRLGRSV